MATLILVQSVYALICGAFGVYIATEKHRSLVEGAIFGGILGIVLAMRPARTKAPPTPSQSDGDSIDWERVSRASQGAGPPIVDLTRRKPRKLLGEVPEVWMGKIGDDDGSRRVFPPPLPDERW